ncbi:sigma-70 family RNA polymerase sigma factor [Myxococcota bacterium]|nr:sigma-70 family RNA polymerase sigma factor [Myxococcota bacterium]
MDLGVLQAQAFREHARYVWGLLYRMTGSAADADDLVQETFARVIDRPPKDLAAPLRPWLVHVAMNLGRDHLRARKRRGYVGPWLPSPIDAGAHSEEPAPPSHEVTLASGESLRNNRRVLQAEGAQLAAGERSRRAGSPRAVTGETESTEARYDLFESVGYAFLVALEALTPSQRAVLLLRDVFDYSVAETAQALGMSESNVKTTHHRARRVMEGYDRTERPVREVLGEEPMRILAGFFDAMMRADVPAIEALLAADVRALSDAGGVYGAALRPIVGPRNLVRFYLKLAQRRGLPARFEVKPLNGRPAVLLEYPPHRPRDATFLVLLFDVAGGRIRRIDTVLAPKKLTHVRFTTEP